MRDYNGLLTQHPGCQTIVHTLSIVLIDILIERGPPIEEPVDQLVGIDRVREVGAGVPTGRLESQPHSTGKLLHTTQPGEGTGVRLRVNARWNKKGKGGQVIKKIKVSREEMGRQVRNT